MEQKTILEELLDEVPVQRERKRKLTRARHHISDGEWKEAAALLNEILEDQPEDKDALELQQLLRDKFAADQEKRKKAKDKKKQKRKKEQAKDKKKREKVKKKKEQQLAREQKQEQERRHRKHLKKKKKKEREQRKKERAADPKRADRRILIFAIAAVILAAAIGAALGITDRDSKQSEPTEAQPEQEITVSTSILLK